MIIDTHQHVFWHGKDDAGLIADMDAQGIDLAWLLSWEIPIGQDNSDYDKVLDPRNFDGQRLTGIPLRDLVTAARRYPDRFVVGYCPDPLSGRAADLFEAGYRIHNVRVCGEWKFRMPFDDPRCIELFRRAGTLKCPVVLHLDAPFIRGENGEQVYQKHWYGGHIDALERALQQCPETIFLGHAPGFWRFLSGDADEERSVYPTGPIQKGGRVLYLLDKYPNLYADLSAGSALNAIRRDRAFGKEFLQRYADRLTFARDIYGGDLITYLRSLELPADVMDKLLFKNAQKLIPQPAVGTA